MLHPGYGALCVFSRRFAARVAADVTAAHTTPEKYNPPNLVVIMTHFCVVHNSQAKEFKIVLKNKNMSCYRGFELENAALICRSFRF